LPASTGTIPLVSAHPDSVRLVETERGIHLLAQLPPEVRMRTGGELDRRLELVARAYGVDHRIERGGQSVGVTFGTDGHDEAATLRAGESFAGACDRIGARRPSTIDLADDELLSGHRVLVVTNLPAHYRSPLFEGIARRLEAADARFAVFFLGDVESERPWLASTELQFDHATVRSFRVPFQQRAPRFPLRLERQLRAFRPTIVVVGGFSPFVTPRIIRQARSLDATVGLWSGETPATASARSAARRRHRRRVGRGVDFGIAYGALALAYLRGLVPELPVVIGRNTAPVRAPNRAISGGSVDLRLVFVGDLASPRKGCDVAIDALRLISDEGVTLRIIGAGSLEGELASHAAGDPRVTFLGPLAPHDVANELSEADVLIFPTRSDVFGLVMVEAMGAGVVPIVSSHAGAVDDLAVDGVNSFVLNDLAPSTWADGIRTAASDRDKFGQMRSHAAQTIEARWTIEHSVDATISGIRLGAMLRRKR
jgi:glycosyltransferase involved in cell wall biosynthesis